MVAFWSAYRESKDGGREAVLRLRRAWPSRGREYLDFYEQSEIKILVTRDRFPIGTPDAASKKATQRGRFLVRNKRNKNDPTRHRGVLAGVKLEHVFNKIIVTVPVSNKKWDN